MSRIGKFTGTVYPDDYDFSSCPECCTCVSEEKTKDEVFTSSLRAKNLIDCLSCMGCPAAKAKIKFGPF